MIFYRRTFVDHIKYHYTNILSPYDEKIYQECR